MKGRRGRRKPFRQKVTPHNSEMVMKFAWNMSMISYWDITQYYKYDKLPINYTQLQEEFMRYMEEME